MKRKNKILVCAALLILTFWFDAPKTLAGGGEYKSVVKHLKTKYQAKKVKIPLVWLARFAVSVTRPAGVKSFSITLFEDLKFSRETLDKEMQTAMRDSFDANWSPVFRVRSRDGQQAYMYMRDAGKTSIKIALVSIDKDQAAVIRATFSPERLADFINNPKIFGVSLEDKNSQTKSESSETKENPPIQKQADEAKKEN